AFGEELMVENAEQALKRATHLSNSEIVDYTAAPVFMDGEKKGAHEWLIEFKTAPKDLGKFEDYLDTALQNLNSDYQAKRHNHMTFNKLKINLAERDLFYTWSKQNDKLGGQHKIPRLSNNREYLEELMELNETLKRKW